MSDEWCPLHDCDSAICNGPHRGTQCHICGNIGPFETLLSHLRDHGIFEQVETWPDGGYVIYDETGEMPS